MKQFPLQTALTIVLVGVLLTAANHWNTSIAGPVLADLSRLVDFRGPTFETDAQIPSQTGQIPVRKPVTLLEDTNGALDHFYAVLSRTRSGAIARVVHYGDSPTTADLITGDVRRLLQKQFGNAGHGFILLEQPWAWYRHYDVTLLSFGWHPTPASQRRVQDGFYGLGGVTFTGEAPARTYLKFAAGRYTRFEVSFLRQPGGGQLSVSSSGQILDEIGTSADKAAAGFAAIKADPPVSELDVAVSNGSVRAFGVVAETGARGVVYDSLGLNGGSISLLARTFSLSHWTAQLRHRNPDMIVINYGTNEADFDNFVEGEYEVELREAIRRVRAALPRSSVLIMSPMDRGRWTVSRAIETMPTLRRIVEIQHRVARDTRCGFFNTFEAMGGAGTVARWHREKPALIAADLIHPHPAGARLIASALVKEIVAGLERFRSREGTPASTVDGAEQ